MSTNDTQYNNYNPGGFNFTGMTEQAFEQAAAFQRIWMDTLTKLTNTGFSYSPESAPPEFARQMRSGVFEAMAKSWDEFMRTPQFLESMKLMMDNAISFKKMSNEFLTQLHHGFQGTAQADIDNLMLAIRHMETRVLDRLEELSGRLERLEGKLEATSARGARSGAASVRFKEVNGEAGARKSPARPARKPAATPTTPVARKAARSQAIAAI